MANQGNEASVTPKRGIYERLNDAKAAVDGYIKKDQGAQAGKDYASLSHDAVTAHCRQAMIDHGILVSPTEVAHLHEDTGLKTRAGNPIFRWEVTLDVRFLPADYNYAEGEDVHAVTVTAHAFDHGDKGPGKAWSYAVKTALLKVMQLETGEDDESRVEIGNQNKGVTDDHIAQLRKAIASAELEEDRLVEHLSKHGRTELSSVEDLTVSLWEYAMQRCARRKRMLDEARAREGSESEAGNAPSTRERQAPNPSPDTSEEPNATAKVAPTDTAESGARSPSSAAPAETARTGDQSQAEDGGKDTPIPGREPDTPKPPKKGRRQ